MAQPMVVTLQLRDELSKGLAGQEANLKRFAAGAGLLVAGAFAAVGAGIGASIKVAADFDKTLSNIGAVGGPAAVAAMDQISAKALQIGKDTAFSSVEAASAMEELTKAGVSVQAQLGGVLDATVALAAAGEIALPQAAELASAAMNQFSLSAEQMPHVADMMAGAANASAISVSDFGESVKALGPAASTVGVSFDDASAAIALMGNYGLKGSMSGNTLKRMLLSLAAPTDTAAARMKQLGINVFDAGGKIKPMSAVAEELKTATSGLSEQARTAALSDIFGSFGLAGAAVLAKEGAAGFNEMAGSMAKVSAADVAKEKLDNLAGSLTILKGSTETAAVMLGSAFQPVLQGLVQNLTGVVNASMPFIETFATEFPARFETFKVGVIAAFQGVTMWVQANWPILAVLAGMVATTVAVSFLSMAGSVAMFGLAMLLNGPIAVAQFVMMAASAVFSFGSMLASALIAAPGIALAFVTQTIPAMLAAGISFATTAAGSVLSFGSMVVGAVAAGAGIAVAFVTTAIPAAAAAALSFATAAAGSVVSFASMLAGAVVTGAGVAAAFLTTTVPAMLVAANSFLITSAGAVANFAVMLAGALMAAPGIAATFLTTTVPAMAAAAVSFVVTAAAAVANFAVMLAGAVVSGVGIAVVFLTTTLPAMIAAGIGFLGMALSAAVAFAGVLAGAIATGIGVALAFWPITLAVIAVIAIGWWLYKNWGMVWGAVVKYTSSAGQFIMKILSGAMTWVTGLIGRAVDWIGARFRGMGTAVTSVVSSLSLGVRKAFAGMASWVTDIIGKMAKWVADKLMILANKALEVIGLIPGAAEMVSGVKNGIGAALNFAKESFDFGGAGEENGEAFGEGFMHGTGSVSGSTSGGGMGAGPGGGGMAGFAAGVMDMMGIEMPEAGGAGAPTALPGMGGVGGGGGGAAAGAGTKDPMGIWSGTDAKGAWTIDPGTGKKIYEAGSVGATGQAAAASDKAAKDAGAQARAGGRSRSAIGEAVAGGLKGGESLDLAKAFTGAISDAADLIGTLAGSTLPSREQWMPKLDLIKQFFMDAGAVFASIAADARNKSDKITGQGALNKGDIENLLIFAEPWQKAMDMLSSTIKAIGDINDMKKIPDLKIMDGIELFMMNAAASGKRVLATIDVATATVWVPVAGAMSTWMDVIGKAAKTANDVATLDIKGDLLPALARVESFMLQVAKQTGEFVTKAAAVLGDQLAGALIASRDVAGTFGAWFDTLGKVGAAAKSVTDVKLDPLWQSKLAGFMTGVAAIGAFYVTGLSNALPPEGRGPALALSRDVAATFSAWGDGLVKIGGAAEAISKAKPVTDAQLADVRSLMTRVAEFGASFLRGPGYDLTRDAKRTAQDLAIVRDVFTTLGAGVDAVAKGGSLDLSKATRVTAAQLQIAQDNTRDALGTMSNLVFFWSLFGSDELMAGIKTFTTMIGPVVDALAKAANLGLDKATRATGAQLQIAYDNSAAAASVLKDLVVDYIGPDGTIPQRTLDLWAGAKAYGDMLGGAVDALGKAGNLGLAEATLATGDQLQIAFLNSAAAASVLKDLVIDYLGPDGKLPQLTLDLWAGGKAYADMLSSAVDVLSKAGNLGLSEATLATGDQLQTAYWNAAAAASVLKDLVVDYIGSDGKLPQATIDMWAGGKLYAENLSSAVDMLSKAAGLGADLVGALDVTGAGLTIAENSARAAFASLTGLSADFAKMDKAARDAVTGPMLDYSKTTSEAIELLTKAAGLGLAVSKARPITPQQSAMLRENLITAVRTVAGAAEAAGPEALVLAREAALKMGPVADAVGKVLDAFDIERIMKSPLIVSKIGSGWLTGVRSKRAEALAQQIRTGLALTFTTLAGAATDMPDVGSDVAAKIAGMVAAYDPLLGLIERLGALKIDLGQVGMLAQVPGLLAGGLGGAAGTGGGSGGASGATVGAPIFTGAITTTGPAYFQGSIEVSLIVDGATLTKVQRSDTWNVGRSRAAGTAGTV